MTLTEREYFLPIAKAVLDFHGPFSCSPTRAHQRNRGEHNALADSHRRYATTQLMSQVHERDAHSSRPAIATHMPYTRVRFAIIFIAVGLRIKQKYHPHDMRDTPSAPSTHWALQDVLGTSASISTGIDRALVCRILLRITTSNAARTAITWMRIRVVHGLHIERQKVTRGIENNTGIEAWQDRLAPVFGVIATLLENQGWSDVARVI
ncbi:hypothetical protein [Burkholderia vietnamiensis]|nr:hypothetical protein [Burkholderia vietnamiensis]